MAFIKTRFSDKVTYNHGQRKNSILEAEIMLICTLVLV